jgi:hypothetical protein
MRFQLWVQKSVWKVATSILLHFEIEETRIKQARAQRYSHVAMVQVCVPLWAYTRGQRSASRGGQAGRGLLCGPLLCSAVEGNQPCKAGGHVSSCVSTELNSCGWHWTCDTRGGLGHSALGFRTFLVEKHKCPGAAGNSEATSYPGEKPPTLDGLQGLAPRS